MAYQDKYCIDCGKKIYYTSIRCRSCANKDENNPFFNKHHTKKSKLKIGNVSLGNQYRLNKASPNLDNYKYNISKKFLIKEYIKNKKSCFQIADKIGCSLNCIYHRLKKYNIKIRNRNEIHRGKKHHWYGKIIHGKWGKYKGINMRSSYEIAYAKYLDKNNIKWQYESKTFDLGYATYTPDFYLPNQDKYIEIKGYWRDDAKKKFKEFKNKYKEIVIEVLTKNKLEKLEVL